MSACPSCGSMEYDIWKGCRDCGYNDWYQQTLQAHAERDNEYIARFRPETYNMQGY